MTPSVPMISHLWSMREGDDCGSVQQFSTTAVAPQSKSTIVTYMSAVSIPLFVRTPSFRRHSTLTVDLSYHPAARWPVQVRFLDSGPGAHYQLWERIFDFGFTTRSGGAGLGLTISRQIATSLGGRLRVQESYMLWGTTFVLELPEGN